MTRERQPRILVIDDDESIRQLLETLLGEEGFDIRTARDGPSGLRSFADDTPDCVLLDVMMPGMDGYQVLQSIRARPESGDVAVVMLTAACDDKHAWEAWRGGVDYFLGKPFDVHALLAYLRSLLSAGGGEITTSQTDMPLPIPALRKEQP